MKTYTFSNFTINPNNETIITDNQLWISLFNTSASDTFRQMAAQEINRYIAEHQEVTFDNSDELVAVLQVYMSKCKPSDNILIIIHNEAEGLEKECVINVPLQPHEAYFKDFKRLKSPK